MTITFLGTGTSQGIPVIGCDCAACSSKNPRDTRLRSSIYIDYNGAKILVDIGPDVRRQLLANRINDIDAILVTHEHNDHTAGLDEVRPINFRYQKSISLHTLPRVAADLKLRFSYAFDSVRYPGAPEIDLHPVTPFETFMVKDCSVLPLPIVHGSLDIIGFKINTFAYLTDVSMIPQATLDALVDLEVLVLSALHRQKHHAHLTLDEAISYALKIGAKKTYLIHMSHTLGPLADWEDELPEGIESAYDGLRIEI